MRKWTIEEREKQRQKMLGDKNPMRQISGLAKRVGKINQKSGKLAGDNNPSKLLVSRLKKSKTLMGHIVVEATKVKISKRNLITLCLSDNSKANFSRKQWCFFYQTLMEIRKL